MISFMIYGKYGAYLNTGTVATWEEFEQAKKAIEGNGQKVTISKVTAKAGV